MSNETSRVRQGLTVSCGGSHIPVLLALAGINNVGNTGDGDTRLGDISRQYALACIWWRWLEYFCVLAMSLSCEHGTY